MAYGGRPLWSRSPRSSPSRGKPGTWRRRTGVNDEQTQRGMHNATSRNCTERHTRTRRTRIAAGEHLSAALQPEPLPAGLRSHLLQPGGYDQGHHRSYLLHDEDYSIVAQYQSEFRGVVNYYLLAYNVSHLGRLRGVMEMSLTRTLAAKHKSTARKMRRQYKSVVETEHGPRVCLKVVKQREQRQATSRGLFRWHPPETATAGRPSRPTASTVQGWPQRAYQTARSGRMRDVRLNGGYQRPPHPCASRPERERPTGKAPVGTNHGGAETQGPLVVCRTCHMAIHHGRSNPRKQQ